MIKIKIENILGHLENRIPYGIDIINFFIAILCYKSIGVGKEFYYSYKVFIFSFGEWKFTYDLPCQTNEVLGRIGNTNLNDIEFHRWYSLTVV